MNGLPCVAGLRVVITGSTRGIGRAIAEAFAQHGATVVVTGRGAAQAEAAVLGCSGEDIEALARDHVI